MGAGDCYLLEISDHILNLPQNTSRRMHRCRKNRQDRCKRFSFGGDETVIQDSGAADLLGPEP